MLLALPFGILAVASIGARSAWAWPRIVSLVSLLGVSLACGVGALERRRIVSRTMFRAQMIQGEMGHGDPIASESTPENNDSPRVSSPELFRKVATKETELKLDEESTKILSSRLLDHQVGIASILLAITLFAALVVFCLVTGQIKNKGPITPIGVSLGVFLVSVPLIIAVHLGLGRVRVRIENGRLHLERRRGVLGTERSEISLLDVKGIWLIQADGADVHELLLLVNSAFLSIPVARSAWPNWQAVFRKFE